MINFIAKNLKSLVFTLGFASIVTAGEKTYQNPVIFVPNVFNTITPEKIVFAQDSFVSGLIFETLFEINSYGEVIPSLAKGWKYNGTTHELTITLHTNHRFYDGSYVQSIDAVNSLKKLCRSYPDHLSALFESIAGCDKNNEYNAEVRVVNDWSLAIKITSTPSVFLHRLSPVGASVFKEKNSELIGSGPYHGKLLSNGNLELIQNPYFHDKPSIRNKGLSFVFRPEKNTHENLLKYQPAGSVMLVSNIDGKTGLADYNKITHVPYITQTLVLNPNLYPLNNTLLRKAIQADFYNNGKLHECNSADSQSFGFIPSGIGGAFVELPSKLQEAREDPEFLTIISRLKNHPVQLTIYRHLGRKNECEELRIKKIFKKYNIVAKITHLSDYNELDELSLSDKAQAYIELFVFLMRDSSKLMSRFTPNPASQKLFYWTSEEISKLIKQTSKEKSIQKRISVYRIINRIIHNNANVIDLYYVGHTNYFHRCYEVAQPKVSFNPNAFYLLKSLQRKANCIIN